MQSLMENMQQQGMAEYAQQAQMEQKMSELSNQQNDATSFFQTMASNAKSAVAKD